ncbi:hypothetical protein MXL46_04555 [Heyndrickxia sporothermodurans]|uniref:Uncharacterized protein n=1 Tax=Clostridium aciditolerans TaxID=339861 RepID=A0A934HU48_9CLOT|nr:MULTISPECIES: hypothetical protein [Bacillota]MBI6873348.1 hypothetical protein [Clostridium aciditolerans]MEB6548380.1 hypothetical protein [Heyndrickxia sporothermodurans]
MNPLYLSLKKAGLIFTRDIDRKKEDFILLETRKNGSSEVDIATFEALFEDVKENPTYEALSGTHTFKLDGVQYTMTAEEMGYQKYFDKWKEQGLFNF